MPTAPGWYPDPTGLPVQRYWDGNDWTEHTGVAPAPPTGNAVEFPTAKLPSPDGPSTAPNRQVYRRKGFVIAASILGMLIVFAIIGALTGNSPKNAADARSQ